MLPNQMSLFDVVEELGKRIYICGKEYQLLSLLSPLPINKRFKIYVNHAPCEWYDPTADITENYFLSEADRDQYLDELNQVCGVDKNGNNLDGWHKCDNHKNNNSWYYGIQRLWTKSIYNRESEYSKRILSEL